MLTDLPVLTAERLSLGLTAVFIYVCMCIWIYARHRRNTAPVRTAPDTDWLIVYASQTGYAQQLASSTAEALRASGLGCTLTPLMHIAATTLQQHARVLFIASTTGEGDAPDNAATFVEQVMPLTLTLPALRYGILALGDQRYKHYCGFAIQLEAWLQQTGATALFDMIKVNQRDPAALAAWQQALQQSLPQLRYQESYLQQPYSQQPASPQQASPDWQPGDTEDWVLHSRTCLNTGSSGLPVYHLVLKPARALASGNWRAGDIAEIVPRNPPHLIAAVLDQLTAAQGHASQPTKASNAAGWPGTDLLADRQIHTEWYQGLADPLDITKLAERLPRLGIRSYSIASVPADGQIELLVRESRTGNGAPGVGAGWLCHWAQPGQKIELQIRSNPSFHIPEDDRPMILIGNGTGIAGLRSLIKQRIAQGHTRNWLLFGERSAAVDFHFADDCAAWLHEGSLQQLDTAFSRDGDTVRYVQDLLPAQQTRLRQWVDQGASLYVCGSAAGMAPEVHGMLVKLLGASTMSTLIANGRYRRDIY